MFQNTFHLGEFSVDGSLIDGLYDLLEFEGEEFGRCRDQGEQCPRREFRNGSETRQIVHDGIKKGNKTSLEVWMAGHHNL